MAKLIIIVILSVALCITGCSSHGGRGMQSPLQTEIRLAGNGVALDDPELQAKSASYYHFLRGQLALNDQQFDQALAHFSEASTVRKVRSPLVHERLARLHLRAGNLDAALEASEEALRHGDQNSSLMLLYAGILESLGRDADAEQVYWRILDVKPDASHAYVLLSSLLARAKRFDDGFAVLEKLRKRNSAEPMGYYYMGKLQELANNLKRAEQEYRKALSLAQQKESIALDLIRVLIKQSKYDEVEKVCRNVLARNPGNVAVRRVLGQILINQERLDDALDELEVLQDAEADPTDTRFTMAVIHVQQRNYEDAVRELNLILAKSPGHAKARYYLGSVFAGLGRKKDALIELRQIPHDHELFVKSMMFGAYLLRQDGHIDQAIELLETALGHKSGDRDLGLSLISIYREGGHFSDALRLIRTQLKDRPEDEKLRFYHGVVLHDLDDETGARKEMENLLALNPDHSDALNFVAYSFAEEGVELERAMDLISRALKLKPNDGYYMDTLGWIHFQRGEYLEALPILQRAVSLTGQDAVILEHLGDVFIKLDQSTKALKAYKSAIERARAAGDRESIVTLERLQNKVRVFESP